MGKKKTREVASDKWGCPICGQYMDFYVVHYRNSPYIDGNTYPRMCFCCDQVPIQRIQHCDEDGSIDYEEGPFFDCKHLAKPEDLFQLGTAESIAEARKCVLAVKRKITEAGGIRVLMKLKLKRPECEYAVNVEAKTKRQPKKVV